MIRALVSSDTALTTPSEICWPSAPANAPAAGFVRISMVAGLADPPATAAGSNREAIRWLSSGGMTMAA